MPDEGIWWKRFGNNKVRKIFKDLSVGAIVLLFSWLKKHGNTTTTVQRIFYDLLIGVIGLLFYTLLTKDKLITGIITHGLPS